MTAFELATMEEKPQDIVDFRVDLLTSPPEIKDQVIQRLDNTLSSQPDAIKIVYHNSPLDEGCLNISVSKLQTGKYTLHILGKIRGHELRTEKELPESTSNNPAIINMRIKHVLLKSRNILKMYYLNYNVKSIENHLIAFVIAV